MSITIYSSGGTMKYTLDAVQAANLHQSLNGECTFDLTMPGRLIKNVAMGDEIRFGDLYFDVTRLAKNGQPTSVSFGVYAEHISYSLSDMEMPEGDYSGDPATVLATILSGSGVSVGTVSVSGTHSITVKSGTSRRTAMLQWATVCGAEISYYQRTVNFTAHVGSSVPVSLSSRENVKSLSVTADSRSNTQSYNVELSRLQHLSLGDEVVITYVSLNLSALSRVISLDYDPFHPMAISMVCGDYVPTYYEAVEETVEEAVDEATEEILDEVDARIAAAVLDSLYADQGYIAELTVDELKTSRRVQLYILQDTSDDNYVDIKGQHIRLMTGTVTSTAPVQAVNRKGEPLYWQRQPTGHTADGFPTDSEGQIPAGTAATAWPVYTYTYTELVKSEYAFHSEGGTYVPMLTLGAGDNNGNSKGYLYKSATELLLQYINSAGNDVSVRLNDDGYVDINKLRRATEMDFSGWDYGYFSEELDGNISCGYLVDFDSQGRPVTIYDDGHACDIVW